MEGFFTPSQSSEVQLKTAEDEEPKMSEAGQRRVLKLYWTMLAQLSGHKQLPEEEIDAFTTRLLEVTSHATSDRMIVFMGIKMKMQMVAEIVEDYVVEPSESSLPEALDLLQLLDRFVDKKFNAYVREKLNMKPTDVHYEYHVGFHRKEFIESHMEAALVLILGDHDFKRLEPKSTGKSYLDFFKSVDNGEHKTAFVDMFDGKPRFVHTVFAEYFAAKWFADHFADNAMFLAKELYTSRFTVIRNLFDRILARDCELHTAVLDADLDGVRHLLDGRGVDPDARDRGGRSALHLAAARAANRLESETQGEILDALIDNAIDVEAEDDILGGSPLLYADTAKSWTAIDKLLGCRADTRHLPATLANVDASAMLFVIFERDLDKLMAFCLDHGLPVEHSACRRLLPWACDEGSSRVATLLIDSGAVIDAVDGEAMTPLALAAASGHLDMVRLLVLSAKVQFYRDEAKKAAQPEPSDRDDEELDYEDALTGLERLQVTNKPTFVNAKCVGTTALHHAADNGHPDVAAYLIREGAEVQSRDDDDATPLHKAVEFGQRVVPILLDDVDADQRAGYVDMADKHGNTALHVAAMCGALKSVHLLRKAGCDLTLRNKSGQTPLIAATENGRFRIVQYLLNTFDDYGVQLKECGSEFVKIDHINVKDANGMSALHTAVRNGHVNVASYLIGQGAFIGSRDSLGRTPLHYAAGQGQEKALGVLLGAMGQEYRVGFVNVEDDDGNTALHRAAQWGRLQALEHLVKAGGSLSQLNKKQQTPLMVADEEEQLEAVTLLGSLEK